MNSRFDQCGVLSSDCLLSITGGRSAKWAIRSSSKPSLWFLEYVKKQRRGGRLFPQLDKGSNGYGDAVGKWFGRLLRHILKIIDPGLVLHSTRHTVITRLHAAGVPTNLVEILVGHASNTVHGTVYVHRENIPLKLLAEALERLRYPVVKLLEAA